MEGNNKDSKSNVLPTTEPIGQHFHSIFFPRVFHSWGKILKSENEIWRVKVLRHISQRDLCR